MNTFLKRVAALVPPPGSNLVRFHGALRQGRRCGPVWCPRPKLQRQLEATWDTKMPWLANFLSPLTLRSSSPQPSGER
ncbi:transposase [Myxococcus sp. RHST-1-4]|nr:transposase [Myxococcus sp. RHSTA-1-4]